MMPYQVNKPCNYPGCRNFVSPSGGALCDSHKVRTTHNGSRPSAARRGYDRRWREFSRGFLQRHPKCVRCGAPSKITDHKIPYEVMVELYGGNTYLDEDYQALCVSCNTLKGAREDREAKRVLVLAGGKGVGSLEPSPGDRTVQQSSRNVSSTIRGSSDE